MGLWQYGIMDYGTMDYGTMSVAAAFYSFVYSRLHAHFFPVIFAFFSFSSLSRN